MSGSAAIIVFQLDPRAARFARRTGAASSPVVALDPANNIVYCTSNGETMSYRLVKGMLRTIGSAPQVTQSGTTSAMSPSGMAISSDPRGGPVIDATGSFAYALNTNTGQIDAFRLASDKRLTPLDPPAYPAGSGAASLAIVAP